MRGLFLVISLMVAACATAGHNGGHARQQVADADSHYAAIVERVKTKGPDADFRALRMAYTDTLNYRRYFGSEYRDTIALFDTMRNGDFERCVDMAEHILDYDYASLSAHFAASVCYKQQGNSDKSEYHQYVATGLMDSIGQSGNGKTPETAFVTINTEEQRTFIQLMGFQVSDQTLLEKNGKTYEVIGAVSPKTGQESKLYFDITIQMANGYKQVQ